MPRPGGHATRRRLAAVLLALGLPAAAAGCGGTPTTLAPLPIESATATATTRPVTSSISPSTAVAQPSQVPPRSRTRTPPPAPQAPTPTPTPTNDATCLGPVRKELVIAETEFDLVKWMCFTAGAILRLQGTEPGLVTVDPDSLVSRSYEAGGENIAFLRPGTVEVTVPHANRIDTITVVIR